MANKKVVPGSLTDPYKKGQGDFSPNLVGLQLTNGTALFTMGNFAITANLGPKTDREFNTGQYSDEFTLENLNLTEQQSQALVSNSIYTTLNLDPNDLSKFVYFGSFVEYLRVSIEGIVSKWKGSLYITDDEGGYSNVAKNTVLGYTYNQLTDESQVTIPILYIENNFGLTYNNLGGLQLDPTDISNIKLSYESYTLKTDWGSFNLLGYTGSTTNVPGVTDDPYIRVTVKGEPFPTLTGATFGTFRYHVKPKDDIVDRLFFDTLSDFENILLNRMVAPQYTSVFESPQETESGTILLTRKSFTWPTTDGFNIDYNTIEYGNYLNGLLKLGTDYDRLRTNLMSRRFVSNSIHEFDTDDGTNDESQGRKINKLLKIYGREFDEVKKYTDSLKFANTVTYNKKNNTPDEIIKILARAMGFEAIKSVSDNQLITYLAKSNQAIFSGESRSMSIQEIDTELWRRLVINAWWLYKSKGTRKVIEFFIKLFGLGECLVNFDECVYVASNKLDVEETFQQIERIIYGDPTTGDTEDVTDTLFDRGAYPIDEEGFPRILPNTPDYYFQMNGFWYNGGTDKTVGNNPHFGPYDYGSAYFDKFRCFIDDYSGLTTTTTQEYIETVNLFSDYNNGDIEITFEDGKPLMDYGTTYANIMNNDDRIDGSQLISAGFTTENSRTGRGSIKMTFTCGGDCVVEPCPKFELDMETGLVYYIGDNTDDPKQPLSQECCDFYNFQYLPSTVSTTYRDTGGKESTTLIGKYERDVKNAYGETVLQENSRLCYWCPQTDVICDFDIYIKTVYKEEGYEGILNILLTEGIISEEQVPKFNEMWNNPEQQSSILIKMINYLNERYNGYCLLVHDNFDEVSKECCRVRGGQWVDINIKDNGGRTDEVKRASQVSEQVSDWRCVIPKEDPCPTQDELEIIILETGGCDISEECCTKAFGDGHWNGYIQIFDVRNSTREGTTVDKSQLILGPCNDNVTPPPCPDITELSLSLIAPGITQVVGITRPECCTKDIVGPITGNVPTWNGEICVVTSGLYEPATASSEIKVIKRR
jgi:hypothetical protein